LDLARAEVRARLRRQRDRTIEKVIAEICPPRQTSLAAPSTFERFTGAAKRRCFIVEL
jgi:hypothetical protein